MRTDAQPDSQAQRGFASSPPPLNSAERRRGSTERDRRSQHRQPPAKRRPSRSAPIAAIPAAATSGAKSATSARSDCTESIKRNA